MGDPALPPSVARRRLEIAPWVFLPGAAIIILLCAYAMGAPDAAKASFGGAKAWIVGSLGWLFHGAVVVFLIFVVWLSLSRFGRLRLGRDDDVPEFSRLTWFSMLFSAGMGIGLMFFSVAEPMYHLDDPPFGEAGTDETARRSLAITFYHWGFHAWAVYGLMGLSLAYFAFRRGLPLSIRSIFHPLIGERIHGRWGDLVDLLAILGTVFGLATSLGLGAKQINAGLHHLFGVANDSTWQVVIIIAVTAAASASLLSGLKRGIRRLSELNMLISAALLVFVFAVGPTAHVLQKFPTDLWSYGRYAVMSAVSDEYRGSDAWQSSWTVFYWAWWIAWAPFVGMFVARVSKGRTIREFVLGVLLAPTCVTVVWLAVFGETAMFMERVHHAGIAAAVQDDSAVAIYRMLETLPFPQLTSAVAIVAVVSFFVTSSDSGSFVVDMLASGGHPNPPIWQRFFWASFEGIVAIALLVAGGLSALQSAAVATGLPFCVVLLIACVSLLKALKQEVPS